ncbi:MAG: SRPBCC family protein [Actinomycetota bacterium]|nr:SRPBCC family protein [Actinomycetota bacterium]
MLDDSASWPRWTPIESYRRIEPPGVDGLGEVRSFRTGQVRVREVIVERVPGRRLAYALIEGLAVRDYRAEIDLEPSAGGCEVRWHTTFRPRFPGTGWIYRRALTKATHSFVDGLAGYSANLT